MIGRKSPSTVVQDRKTNGAGEKGAKETMDWLFSNKKQFEDRKNSQRQTRKDDFAVAKVV